MSHAAETALPPAPLAAAACARGRARGRDAAGFAAAALIGTALSLLRSGFVFGWNNNLFHLPILAGLYWKPQFAGDPFIQSLRWYASGLWAALAGTVPAAELGPGLDGRGALLLLGLHAASRFAALTGFLACASVIGVRGAGQRVAFAVLIAFSPLLNGYSYAGGGGLFISSFTHSEVANATTLLMLWSLARGRIALALAFNGATFLLNAFMAVWNLAPFVLLLPLLLPQARRIGWPALARRIAIGAAAFCVLAAPALYLILSNPDFGRPIDFDYRQFLIEYYPGHFLVRSFGRGHLVRLAAVAAAGALAALELARRNAAARFCGIALCGYAMVWLGGAALSLVIGAPLILNLHLLRSSGDIHLVSALAIASLTVVWAFGPCESERRIWAPLLLLAGGVTRSLVLATPFVMPLARLVAPPRWLCRLRLDIAAAVLCVAVLWPEDVAEQWRGNAVAAADVAAWHTLGQWAARHTEPSAVFLLPTAILMASPIFPPFDEEQARLASGSVGFETYAERRVWVDVKRGAAVMWMPSYYDVWFSRVGDVLALRDHAARMEYARAHGIGFVIDGCGAPEEPAFAAGGRCIYRAAPSRDPAG